MPAELEKILRSVQKPGRYIGEEWNVIRKDPAGTDFRIALVFPDMYEVGMSYLGQKILYHVLNRQPNILAERVFTPAEDMEQSLTAARLPLFSLENKIPLKDFDILAFSLLYELNYTNVLTVLNLSEIPVLTKDRSLSDPLVIAGGPAACNPEPMADFFDAFFIGDGEEAFFEIIDVVSRMRKSTARRKEILEELSRIPGMYIPSLYGAVMDPHSSLMAVEPMGKAPARISKRVLSPFGKAPFPEDIIVPNVKTIFDRVTVEAARGCPQNCRFCQASNLYFPYRAKDPDFIIRKALGSLKSTGYEELSLASLSIGDYPRFNRLIEVLMQSLGNQKVALSLSSLRPQGLTEELTENILKVRKTGFTLVPEAGTARLRRVINKHLTDEEIYSAVETAFSQGWKLLKLYFMVGLPTENQADLQGIVDMILEIIRIGYRVMGHPPRINLSVSSFLPKPHTPFQWVRMEDVEELREKHLFLKSQLKRYRFISFKEHALLSSRLEGIFSRGDRRLSQVAARAWKNGARFDSWNDRFHAKIWELAFRDENVNPEIFLGELDTRSVLPWDHIDVGISKEHLLKEWNRALDGETTAPCRERNCRECRGCTQAGRWETNLPEPSAVIEDETPVFGQSAETDMTYRVTYSKTGPARYLSHIDVNNIILRGFRRAGVKVLFTQGYHPKMQVSYAPALPLGMSGMNELFEFRSDREYSEKDFIFRMNGVLPPGIRMLKIRGRASSKPALNTVIRDMEYSLDPSSPEVETALRRLGKSSGIEPEAELAPLVAKLAEAQAFSDRITVSITEAAPYRILFRVPYRQDKPVRIQSLLEEKLGIENLVFLMARERIRLRSGSSGG